MRWFDVDPCYVFHPLNAYDDGDDVVIDVVRWDGMFRKGHQGPIESGQHSSLRRWTVDRPRGKVREDVIDDRPQEFPRVDERLVGRRHRYGYRRRPSAGVIASTTSTAARSETLDFGATSGQNEAVFVPAHDGAAEDDGWLLVPHLRRGPDTSDLDHHRRAGPHRRPGGDGPPRPPGPLRLPRQLGARRLIQGSDG